MRDRETGATLNTLRERLEAAVERARRGARRASELDTVLADGAGRRHAARAIAGPRGHLHLITQIRREVEDVFLGLGYEIFDGPEVETRTTTSPR